MMTLKEVPIGSTVTIKKSLCHRTFETQNC